MTNNIVVLSYHIYAIVLLYCTGVKLTAGQRRESYDGVHYSDLTYDAFAQVAVNLVTHLERTGTIGAAAASGADPDEKPFVKPILGMGSVPLGLMVVLLASVMVLSRDAYHGMARLALTVFGGRHHDAATLTWEKTYGDLLRKIGRHPHGQTPPSEGVGGGVGGGKGAGVSGDAEEANKLLPDEDGHGETKQGGRGTGGRGSLEMSAVKYAA